MSDKVKLGIIGVGQIGKNHLRTYAKIAGAEIVAAADINETELARVADEFDIPNTYTDFRELLKRDDLAAVDVCLHNNFHMPVTTAVLESGKHAYCEKPIAGAYIDGVKMVETAKATGQMLHIQLATLYSKETKAAKYLIEKGALGKLYHARSTGFRRRGRPYVDGYGTPAFVQKRNSGGGAFYDMGVYHIARMLYLLGNPAVIRITGKTYQETAIDPRRLEISNYNVEELGMGFVRLEGNIALDIIESWAIHLDTFGGSYVVGADGGIRLEPFGYYHSIGDVALNSSGDLGQFDYRQHNVHEIGDVYDSSQHHWVAALQGRVDLLPTAEVALNTMLISEGIYLSEKLDREVTAEEVREMSESTSVKL